MSIMFVTPKISKVQHFLGSFLVRWMPISRGLKSPKQFMKQSFGQMGRIDQVMALSEVLALETLNFFPSDLQS